MIIEVTVDKNNISVPKNVNNFDAIFTNVDVKFWS